LKRQKSEARYSQTSQFNKPAIEEQIKQDLRSVSKIKIEQWKHKALEDTEYFKAAVKIGLTSEKPYCWRCSWIISKVVAENPAYIDPYIEKIIHTLEKFRFDSQIGGFLKALTYAREINEELLGILTDYCIKIIYDTQRPSHNKYYAIQLLLRIAKKYPGLSREFSLVIEENMPYFEKAYLKKFGREAIKTFFRI
jgi:hypothetical protein